MTTQKRTNPHPKIDSDLIRKLAAPSPERRAAIARVVANLAIRPPEFCEMFADLLEHEPNRDCMTPYSLRKPL